MARWIDKLEQGAAEHLPRQVYNYYRQGAGTHHACDEATPAWDALRIRPRVLRDVTTVSTATTVLGTYLATPVLVAPTAVQHLAEATGEAATALGAARAGSLVCVSCFTAQPYTDIRDTGSPWWAQVYVLRDRSLTRDLVARAEAAGAAAIVVTVDTPVLGDRPFPAPDSHSMWYGGRPLAVTALHDVTFARDLTFDDIAWLREISDCPSSSRGSCAPTTH